ncbi:hypothetical protein [Terricaulis sp.]|uniref:hypothetical protein n=1 Tax=Terricaulis sp. TaxID=2768686 RepID=UPI003782F1E4
MAAFAVCALAFVAGVVGDLTEASTPRSHGARVVLLIPPDAPRAHPLPPLPETSDAQASPAPRQPHLRRVRYEPRAAIENLIKPSVQRLNSEPKIDLDFAAKPDRHKDA